ncbi:MAG: 3-dehydroquinate synthase [Syntrophomonadaceae bacterium]|nr:3-dehydroquinate synthase [Syntrophomonadaceae bacterium]
MLELAVELGPRSYNISIENNLLSACGRLARGLNSNEKALLVSNPKVFNLYGNAVADALDAAGFEITVALMPDGEEYKNLEIASEVLDAAVGARLERGSLLFALGGGVVGDLAGFVAAIYQRGIDFIQIPTTLLAQVDSSVGGKVAVNHPQGKNLIGAFHQPRAVIIDPLTLNTLEDRDYLSGLGEVVKYGIIYDSQFFEFLEDYADNIAQRDNETIAQLIYHSCRIKSEIVAQDEREAGLRAILNLGHTFGHAVETLTGYGTHRHGEAVVMGTRAAAHLAADLGYITEGERQRISRLYKRLKLDFTFPELDPSQVYQSMLGDKKVSGQKLRLVLPRGIGRYVIIDDPGQDRLMYAAIIAQQE